MGRGLWIGIGLGSEGSSPRWDGHKLIRIKEGCLQCGPRAESVLLSGRHMVWTCSSIGISEKRVLSGLRKNPKDAVQTIFLLFGGIIKQQFSRKLIFH